MMQSTIISECSFLRQLVGHSARPLSVDCNVDRHGPGNGERCRPPVLTSTNVVRVRPESNECRLWCDRNNDRSHVCSCQNRQRKPKPKSKPQSD